MALDRLLVERLLQAYVQALEATQAPAAGRVRHEYASHYDTARNLLARWQGGESEARLHSAVEVELSSYRIDPPGGKQAELIGAAFGDVCRAVGVM
jgi:hypothetical protein